MADAEPFSTGVEHYTRTVACPTRVHHYVAKCLSLVATPPPPASTAIYDPEGWLLTSAGEQANYCAAMRLAARLIRADGATAVIAPPSPESKPLVECAARYSAEIILQAQPHEADTAEYMHVIRRASRWARSVSPLVRVDFVLSTNSKYGAGVADMVADYVAAQTYLGGQAAWWLNIIPEKGVPDADVPTAVALLAGAASGSFP